MANKRLPLFMLVVLLASCAHDGPSIPGASGRAWGNEEESLRLLLNQTLEQPRAETSRMDVFFMTNRENKNPTDCSRDSYKNTLSKELSFGRCRVNAPKKAQIGDLAVASTPRADSNQFYRLLDHSALKEDEFVRALQESKATRVLVFVHGFNVDFEEAVFRAAQLAYDLKYQGPVVLMTWPAGPQDSSWTTFINRTYEFNTGNAANSIDTFAGFFVKLAALNIRVDLLVHSMGHQIVLPAVSKAQQTLHRKFLNEIILNAPDLPVDLARKLAPDVLASSRRVTVYCSYNDKAISASESYNKNRRMGGCEEIDGFDVVNAGALDDTMLGHGYYASRPILTDVSQVLLGIDAERRLFLRKSEPNSVENYYLRK